MTKLFKFLDSYLPLRVQVKLLRVVDTDKPFNDADFMEKYYINYYRKINPNLLNSLRYSQVCDESRNVYARFYL